MKTNFYKLLVFVLLFSTIAPSISRANTEEANLLSAEVDDANVEYNNADFINYNEENITNLNDAEIQPMVLPAVPVVASAVIAFLARKSLKEAGEFFGKRVVISLLGNGIKKYSAVWKGFKNYRGSIKTSGSGSKKKYYEWDNTHSDIEVYDKNGNHLGSMDPFDGEMYKPPVPGRHIKDKL